MTWNYRVMKRVKPSHPNDPFFVIVDVFYDDDGNIDGWGEPASEPFGSTLVELRDDYDLMALAFDSEPLDEEELLAQLKAKRTGTSHAD